MSIVPNKPLNVKEQIERKKLNKMHMNGKKMTRKQLLRGIQLNARSAAAYVANAAK